MANSLQCVKLLTGVVDDEYTSTLLHPRDFQLPFNKTMIDTIKAKEWKKEYPPFIRIKSNIYLSKKLPEQILPDHRCQCHELERSGGTFRTKLHDSLATRSKGSKPRHGCGENCQNRLLFFECTETTCSMPEASLCLNRPIQNRQLKNTEIQYRQQKGFGLVAKEVIRSGEFVIEYIGEVIDDEECERRLEQCKKQGENHFYLMEIERDAVIDARYRSNNARFINHSCNPNCETQKWNIAGNVRVGIFAIKDIAIGEEITFDYQFNHFGDLAKCACGAENCTGVMNCKRLPDKNVETNKTRNDIIKSRPVNLTSFSRFKRSQLDQHADVNYGFSKSRLFIVEQHGLSGKKICRKNNPNKYKIWYENALNKSRDAVGHACGGITDWTRILGEAPSKKASVSPGVALRAGLQQAKEKRFSEIEQFSTTGNKWNKRLRLKSRMLDSNSVIRLLQNTQTNASSVNMSAEDENDLNEDMCLRCGRPGQLICCDGCPAAYHLTCAGIFQVPGSNQSWFCTACRSKQRSSRANRQANLVPIPTSPTPKKRKRRESAPPRPNGRRSCAFCSKRHQACNGQHLRCAYYHPIPSTVSKPLKKRKTSGSCDLVITLNGKNIPPATMYKMLECTPPTFLRDYQRVYN